MEDKTAPSREEEETTGELSARQHVALATLLLCPTIRQAAAKSKVPETTLHRWLASPVFSEAYKEARNTALQQAMECLQSTAGEVVATMLSLMKDTKKPASARIAAGRTLLEYCFRAREMMSIEERLAQIEETLKAREGK